MAFVCHWWLGESLYSASPSAVRGNVGFHHCTHKPPEATWDTLHLYAAYLPYFLLQCSFSSIEVRHLLGSESCSTCCHLAYLRGFDDIPLGRQALPPRYSATIKGKKNSVANNRLLRHKLTFRTFLAVYRCVASVLSALASSAMTLQYRNTANPAQNQRKTATSQHWKVV